MVKLSAIQLTSTPDVGQNIAAIARQLERLALLPPSEHHLVVLPECCLFFGGNEESQLTLARQTATSNLLQAELAGLAKQYQLYLVAGTIPMLAANPSKFCNTSCVFSPRGELLQSYDKIHLFDVSVQDSSRQYLESKYTEAGKKTCVVDTPFAQVGLSVCYDLRFPELFRHLRNQGADIITVPSAFTRVTGKAHWQALLQARAIENQVYIIAAGQEGVHANGRETWGHSMIISPWGEILSCLEQGEGVISTTFLTEEIIRVRDSIPVAQHNQFTVELKSYE